MSLKSVFANRIKNPFKMLVADFKHGNFGLGINRFLCSFSAGTSLGRRFESRVQKSVYLKLEKNFLPVLEKYKNSEYVCKYDSKAPIWILWMQGYDSAPPIVKKCIDSVKKSTSHPVNLITDENIYTYYDFPDYIRSKLKNGIITKAQFSDILRMTLLAEYGGLWIDATVFVPKSIPEEIFKKEFFTCKRYPVESGYVSQYRWTSFLNGCQKNCVVQRAAKDLFFEYWRKNDYLIDYLLVDYTLLIIYNNILRAKNLIDTLEYNNTEIEELQNIMNDVFDEDKYLSLMNSHDTYFFKLSWRMNFADEKGGQKTFYGKFIE